MGAIRYDTTTPEAYQVFDNTNGLLSNGIFNIIFDKKGAPWLGTYGGGLSHWENKRWVNYNTPNGLCDAFVYDVELKPGQGGQLGRSAGTAVKIMAREGGYVNLQLPSGEVRKVMEDCAASVGSVSNPENAMVTVGKAGRSRHMGVRPTVRGTAMNPVDHPHGGGEGKQPRGLKRSKNYWGKGVRGVKTRKRKNRSNVFIVKRRK